jgi:hypothetical protein
MPYTHKLIVSTVMNTVVVEMLIKAWHIQIFTDVYGTRNFISHAKQEECSMHCYILIVSFNLGFDLENGFNISGF